MADKLTAIQDFILYQIHQAVIAKLSINFYAEGFIHDELMDRNFFNFIKLI